MDQPEHKRNSDGGTTQFVDFPSPSFYRSWLYFLLLLLLGERDRLFRQHLLHMGPISFLSSF